MKNLRKEKILELIQATSIETQEDLIKELRRCGFEVTQSTVSRDIKQLGLVKVLDENKNYKYAPGIAVKEAGLDNTDRGGLLDVFKNSVIRCDYAMNDLVIKCYSGMAQGACVAFDILFADMFIGTLAGDDTIFAITANEETAAELAGKITKILR